MTTRQEFERDVENRDLGRTRQQELRERQVELRADLAGWRRANRGMFGALAVFSPLAMAANWYTQPPRDVQTYNRMMTKKTTQELAAVQAELQELTAALPPQKPTTLVEWSEVYQTQILWGVVAVLVLLAMVGLALPKN